MKRTLLLALVAACSGRSTTPAPTPVSPPAEPVVPAGGVLRGAGHFASIADPVARSRALFLEVSRVLAHPRCANCHPPDDSPRQGDGGMLHDPPVIRGASDRGVPGMQCFGCHQDRNLELARVPGAPDWHLAPLAMAWHGKTPAEICAQLKAGPKTLAQTHAHLATDKLVAWGFAPGADRRPPPGTPAEVAALFGAWMASGAHCPTPDDEVPRP